VKKKIALMGVSGAGKDYLASYLTKNHGFARFSFSDQLKRLAQLIYPWLELDYPPIIKEKALDIQLSTGERITKSPREIWLHLNALRDIEQNIFIRMLSDEIKDAQSQNQTIHFLISDIRSTDEFHWCKSNNFMVIYIKREKQIYQDYEIDAQISKNMALADFTFINQFDGVKAFEAFYQTNIVPNILKAKE
jgi:dephospho-CoA kinase